MFYVYILVSLVNQYHYTGFTPDLHKRLLEHNNGITRSTQKHRPFRIIYSEEYNTKSEALKREKQIKSYKSGRAFKQLLLGRDGGAVKRNSL